MLRLSDEFLEGMGVESLPREEKDQLLANALYALQLRVTERLAVSLDDSAIEEFNTLDDHDQAAQLDWLEAHCPQYADVVTEEMADLRQRILGQLQRAMGDTA